MIFSNCYTHIKQATSLHNIQETNERKKNLLHIRDNFRICLRGVICQAFIIRRMHYTCVCVDKNPCVFYDRRRKCEGGLRVERALKGWKKLVVPLRRLQRHLSPPCPDPHVANTRQKRIRIYIRTRNERRVAQDEGRKSGYITHLFCSLRSLASPFAALAILRLTEN